MIQGDLTANTFPTHGTIFRAPYPGGGGGGGDYNTSSENFFIKLLSQIITNLMTRPRDFKHHIHVFTKGRGLKPQFV